MNLISEKNNGSRKVEIYKTSGGFEVFCMVGESMSHGFPVKPFKSEKGAERYGDKFLNK